MARLGHGPDRKGYRHQQAEQASHDERPWLKLGRERKGYDVTQGFKGNEGCDGSGNKSDRNGNQADQNDLRHVDGENTG